MNLSRALLTSAALAGALLSSPVAAQVEDPEVAAQDTAASSDDVDFAADQLDYDRDKDIVIASGNVRMSRDGNRVRADQIIWDRRTGDVRAEGSVIIEGAEGDRAFGEHVDLKESLRDGVVEVGVRTIPVASLFGFTPNNGEIAVTKNGLALAAGQWSDRKSVV